MFNRQFVVRQADNFTRIPFYFPCVKPESTLIQQKNQLLVLNENTTVLRHHHAIGDGFSPGIFAAITNQ